MDKSGRIHIIDIIFELLMAPYSYSLLVSDSYLLVVSNSDIVCTCYIYLVIKIFLQ